MEASSVHVTGKREGRPPAGTSLGVGQGHGGHTGRAQPTRTHRSTPRRPHRAPEPRLQGFAPQNKLLLRHRKTSAQDERNGENQAVRGQGWDGGPHTDKGPRGPLPTAPRHFTQAAPARPVTSPRPGTPGGRGATGTRPAQGTASGGWQAGTPRGRGARGPLAGVTRRRAGPPAELRRAVCPRAAGHPPPAPTAGPRTGGHGSGVHSKIICEAARRRHRHERVSHGLPGKSAVDHGKAVRRAHAGCPGGPGTEGWLGCCPGQEPALPHSCLGLSALEPDPGDCSGTCLAPRCTSRTAFRGGRRGAGNGPGLQDAERRDSLAAPGTTWTPGCPASEAGGGAMSPSWPRARDVPTEPSAAEVLRTPA